MPTRLRTPLCVALAGGCLAAAMPPWGWWPLAFVGIALTDRLLADQPARVRAVRMWGVAAAWLFPATVWMLDLTPPGWVIAQVTAAAMFALAAAAVPAHGRPRQVGLAGRSCWPSSCAGDGPSVGFRWPPLP
jgi:apolipoprotein N-acyltransferase